MGSVEVNSVVATLGVTLLTVTISEPQGLEAELLLASPL
jgi:hypothetical protein